MFRVLLFVIIFTNIGMIKPVYPNVIKGETTIPDSLASIFSSSWSDHLELHSAMDTYHPRVLAKNCFSVSAFFSFLLIAVNTVVNVSTNNNNNNNNDNNNNNNNNNNDNNINSNMFMLMPPRKREYPSYTSPIWSIIQSTNTLALSKLNSILQSQPNCLTIVKCDLLALLTSANPPPLLASLVKMFGPDQCREDLFCSLLP
jgi:hypothetical protein